MSTSSAYPERFDSLEQLEDALSQPTDAVIETLARLDGDVLVLGAAGKMGPTLSRMAKRGLDEAGRKAKVIAVSRFSDSAQRAALESAGVDTIVCDLLDEAQLNELPDAANLVYMAGMKFGSTGAESLTWAMNSYLPALVCRRYSSSRIVAFSTGNVYGLTSIGSGGSRETDPLAPVGEYAMSCLGRERIFEHFSRTRDIRLALIRLNYAVDLRYGTIVDIAQQVLAGQPIDVTTGYFNAVWQGDANAVALQALGHVATPPMVLNLTGPELLSVRDVAKQLGEIMDTFVQFEGSESDDALLANVEKMNELFGPPAVSADQLIRWVAHWITAGGATLGKPTHFESREGKF